MLVLGHGLCRLFDTRLGEGGGRDEYVWTRSICVRWPQVVVCAFTFGDFEPLLAIDRVALDNCKSFLRCDRIGDISSSYLGYFSTLHLVLVLGILLFLASPSPKSLSL